MLYTVDYELTNKLKEFIFRWIPNGTLLQNEPGETVTPQLPE